MAFGSLCKFYKARKFSWQTSNGSALRYDQEDVSFFCNERGTFWTSTVHWWGYDLLNSLIRLDGYKLKQGEI